MCISLRLMHILLQDNYSDSHFLTIQLSFLTHVVITKIFFAGIHHYHLSIKVWQSLESYKFSATM